MIVSRSGVRGSAGPGRHVERIERRGGVCAGMTGEGRRGRGLAGRETTAAAAGGRAGGRGAWIRTLGPQKRRRVLHCGWKRFQSPARRNIRGEIRWRVHDKSTVEYCRVEYRRWW